MGEGKQRWLCFVSSEKCRLIPWQFLGRFCTCFQPDTQLSKVLNVNSSVLYPFMSPYSHWHGMWTTGIPYFDERLSPFDNNLFTSLPFIFSLSCMLLQPKILRLTSHIFKRLAYSWSGQVVWYRAPKGLAPFLVSCLAWVSPQTREFSVLNFKTPLILVLLHVELSVSLWY